MSDHSCGSTLSFWISCGVGLVIGFGSVYLAGRVTALGNRVLRWIEERDLGE